MTINIRERIYRIMFLGALLIAATTALLVAVLVSSDYAGPEGQPVFALDQGDLFANTAAVLTALVASLGITYYMAFRSGRTAAAELFFFALWALGLAFEASRVGMVFFMVRGTSTWLLAFMTRLGLFGRNLCLLSLFMGSVLSVGFKHERMIGAAGAAFLVALFFATVQPLNSGSLAADFLIQRGFSMMLWGFEAIMIVLLLVNHLIAWRIHRDTAFLVSGLGLIFCLLGGFLLRQAFSAWLIVPALASIGAGAWMHIRNMNAYYLWH
jgi:hypothetical protein